MISGTKRTSSDGSKQQVIVAEVNGKFPSFRPTDRRPSFFLVQSHANAERFAARSLIAPYRGCVVYLPMTLETVVHARRKKDVERAFLSRYLFVEADDAKVPAIKSAPGVSHIVRRDGGSFLWVRASDVDKIRDREVEAVGLDGKPARFVGLDPRRSFGAPAPRYAHGEEVRVTDGPFASFNALFEEHNGDSRAKLAVNIFGRMTPVELELDQFEKL